MRGRGTAAAIVILIVLGMTLLRAAQAPLGAAEPSLEAPALISADQVTYDESLGVVTASGNVEIAQEGRVLHADSVSYNLRSNVVTASGNVSLMEPTGEVVFADFVELTDNLKDGFIRDIRVLLTDRSRLAAVSGSRSGGNLTVFRKGVYSPCELCREDPTRPPLWQIKAVEVEHDQKEKVIRYRDAWMEFYGVPILYTPYFEHPDPTVERKSGLLAPTFGSTESLGATYQQPYYWVFGPDQDVTFAPIVTSKQGVVLAGDYRQLLPNGRLDLRASATKADRTERDGTVKSNVFRGHVDGTARFDIDRTWRAGLDLQRASDDTYLRLYNFSDERTLTSRAFAEGFNGRNYLAANAFLYQGLRASDNNNESPIIFPMVDYNFVSEPGAMDSTYTLDANFLTVSRIEGRESRRLSGAVSWELPYTGPIGDVYNLVARVQGDGYWTDGVDPTSSDVNPQGNFGSDLTGRLFPQLALQWRYPWVQHGENYDQVIEPIAQMVVSPTGANPGEIPNEDSLDFEFDDTNLFSLNRFPGIDRVDSGTRFDYGLKWTANGFGGYADALIGQSYRLEKSDAFAPGSGISDNLSDIVGRVQVRPREELALLYRFRFDKDNLRARRNELALNVGPPALNLDLSYVLVKAPTEGAEFGDREELNWTLRSKLSRYWSAFGGTRFDLERNATLQSRIGIAYADECFLIQGVAERRFYADRDIAPQYTFFINVVFKNLGGLTSDGLGGF